MKKFFIILFFLTNLIFPAKNVFPAVIIYLSDTDLVLNADKICIAAVTDTESYYEDGMFTTKVHIYIERTFFGDTESISSFIIPGGRIGNSVSYVEGSPPISNDMTILLFLEKAGENFVPIGLKRGVFEKKKDKATNKYYLINDSEGISQFSSVKDMIINDQKRIYDYTEFENFITGILKNKISSESLK